MLHPSPRSVERRRAIKCISQEDLDFEFEEELLAAKPGISKLLEIDRRVTRPLIWVAACSAQTMSCPILSSTRSS